MPQLPLSKVSLEDYRQQEQTAEFRSEYRDGEIVPMTGGSINHNRIVRNLIRLLDTAFLENKNFEVFPSDLRIWIPQYRRATYPDISVVSGEVVFNDDRADEILNPYLMVEVLSKSTENYDRGNKFLAYRSINTLREYLLVSRFAPIKN